MDCRRSANPYPLGRRRRLGSRACLGSGRRQQSIGDHQFWPRGRLGAGTCSGDQACRPRGRHRGRRALLRRSGLVAPAFRRARRRDDRRHRWCRRSQWRGPAEKLALHRKTGAQAADMESHIAARCRRRMKLPFAAFRVVADPADRQLPHAALVAISPDGSIALGAILGSLARDPRQVPQLMRTANDARAGLRGSIPLPEDA